MGWKIKFYLLQGVESSQKAMIDDFTMSTLVITYAEKKEAVALVSETLGECESRKARRIRNAGVAR